ncbi:MAG: ABC transporter ATP-binding protein [Paracoccaceae bacterium]|jgi:putative spermidine/putrescine transport system ATP-binding protein/putrescine transport system ATP-binding protein
MQASSQTVISFDNVRKSFGTVAAVDGISFSAEAGETVALLGPSGCGKTTTLRLIAGFEDPDTGHIEIGAESVIGKRPFERNVGLLFQHYALFPHMSVGENVAYGLKHRNWPKSEIAARVAEMLRLVQLDGYGDRRPRQLSGGQQQRVALARVLATKPKLVLLDEPLSALDAKLREELGAELKQILTSVGSTTLVVTHDQDEAMSLADRIIVMNRGRIDQQGAPSEIYSRPETRFVASFMGRSTWLDGTLKHSRNDGLVNVVMPSGTVLSAMAKGISDDTPVSVGVRPERISIAAAADKRPELGANQFPGEVVEARYMGAEVHYVIRCAFGLLTVVQPSTRTGPFARSAKVKISFCAEDCIVFPASVPRQDG